MNIVYDVLLAKQGRLKSQHPSDRFCEPSKITTLSETGLFSFNACLKRFSVCIFPKIEVIGVSCYKIRVNN